MPIVDLKVLEVSPSPYANQYVVEITFLHPYDEITATETAVFSVGQKADVIEFVNFLNEAGDYVREHGLEPDEVKGYEKWCEYSEPGLQVWPSDANGNYFANLEDVDVSYFDVFGNCFDVELVEG
jgi:hypothetical protein